MLALALVRAGFELHTTSSPAELTVTLVVLDNICVSLLSSYSRGIALEVVADSLTAIAWNILACLVHHGQLKSVVSDSVVTIWIPRSASGCQKKGPTSAPF